MVKRLFIRTRSNVIFISVVTIRLSISSIHLPSCLRGWKGPCAELVSPYCSLLFSRSQPWLMQMASSLSHLVGFILKLRNLGIQDHGLIRELSAPLVGSLVGGEGHSRLHDEENIY